MILNTISSDQLPKENPNLYFRPLTYHVSLSSYTILETDEIAANPTQATSEVSIPFLLRGDHEPCTKLKDIIIDVQNKMILY